jgi:hypothetical protein
MTVTQVNAIATALDSALVDDDASAALTAARRLKAALASFPDSADKISSLTWKPESLDTLIMDLRQQVNARQARTAGAIRTTKINYVRPRGGDCD